MSAAPRWHQPLGYALLLFGTAIVFIITARTGTVFLDDAFITFTYAKNLANGNGFVYNAPPATFGTTTPLWTLVLTVAAKFAGTAAIPTAALWLSGLCWAGIAWVLFLARRLLQLSAPAAGLMALLLCTATQVNLGMEQALFQFLLMLLLVTTLAGRWAGAGVFAGLLFLTRGEGALAAFLAGVYALYVGRREGVPLRPALRLCAGFAVPVLPWLAYAALLFGTILPHTLGAKTAQLQLAGYESFTDALIRALATEWPNEASAILRLVHFVWPFLLLGLGALAYRRSPLLGLVAWTVLYAAAYAALRVADFFWYETPVYWTWLVCLAAGMTAAIRWASGLRRRAPRLLATGYLALIVVVIVGVRAGFALATAGERPDMHAEIYLPAATWLREHAAPGERVALAEVGYLGFYTELPIIDQFGLVTPAAQRFLGGENLRAFLQAFQPNYYLAAQASGGGPDTGASAVFAELGFREVAQFSGEHRVAILYHRE